jgi:hypothetical protein
MYEGDTLVHPYRVPGCASAQDVRRMSVGCPQDVRARRLVCRLYPTGRWIPLIPYLFQKLLAGPPCQGLSFMAR